MTFLGTKKLHFIFWPLVVIWFLATKFTTFSTLRLSLDSIFSGLLALTGFVFTARTFITFKLNEVIYDSPQYRKFIEKLQKDGAYKKQLYDPLKHIDSNLGKATYMCFWATIMAIIVAFLPKPENLDFGNGVHIEYVWQLLSQNNLNTAVSGAHITLSLIFKAFTDTSMIYFAFCLGQMIIAAKSLHQNIGDIIEHWEEDYNKNK